MQGEKLIISNDHFFKFYLIPYFSKFIAEFSLSISSKFKFYLYFNYLIEFIIFFIFNMNKNISKLQDPDSESSLDADNIPPIQKCWKILSRATYRKQLEDENGQLLYAVNSNMPSSRSNLG
jgi:hypothetical protein